MQTEEAMRRALRRDLQRRIGMIADVAGLPGPPKRFGRSEGFMQWYWEYRDDVAVVLSLTMGDPYREIAMGLGVQSSDADGPWTGPIVVPTRFASAIAADETWLLESLQAADAAARIETAF